jgi:hypothetical protein
MYLLFFIHYIFMNGPRRRFRASKTAGEKHRPQQHIPLLPISHNFQHLHLAYNSFLSMSYELIHPLR